MDCLMHPIQFFFLTLLIVLQILISIYLFLSIIIIIASPCHQFLKARVKNLSHSSHSRTTRNQATFKTVKTHKKLFLLNSDSRRMTNTLNGYWLLIQPLVIDQLSINILVFQCAFGNLIPVFLSPENYLISARGHYSIVISPYRTI